MDLVLYAPAKINWFLSVLNKRDDGFHNIVSLMQCVDLYDKVTLGHDEEIELTSSLNISPKNNLVYRAANLLKKYSGYAHGARIILEKKIPISAGLGGGSSDAASTLKGLNELWNLGLSKDVLMRLGSELGSDVPFFIDTIFGLAEGRGEILSPMNTGKKVVLLLVKPDISVSTAWAYSAYTPELTKNSVDIKLFCQTLEKNDFENLRHLLFNDLEKVVLYNYPEIGRIKSSLLANGAVISAMSGSGPTVFGVFNSEEEAVHASENIRGHWCRVVNTLTADLI